MFLVLLSARFHLPVSASLTCITTLSLAAGASAAVVLSDARDRERASEPANILIYFISCFLVSYKSCSRLDNYSPLVDGMMQITPDVLKFKCQIVATKGRGYGKDSFGSIQ